MKKFIVFSLISALSLVMSLGTLAAEKKPSAATPAPAAAADANKPPTDEKPRILPMRTRVDAIDAEGKTFTLKRKDGVDVKNVVTSKTEIRNGGSPAKFSDIKVGDYVNGSRIKKSPTEWEVVKITKIGPAPAKKPKDAEQPE